MAVKSRTGKGSYKAYKDESRHAKNQARKRAKHAKNHPNDKQSLEGAKVGYKRKKPLKAGSAPAANRTKFYRDNSGKRLSAPHFNPDVK
jgi:hypothetical protein